ncbi:MAG TPA: YdcF family protein, partial [Abditibacterium sp.]
KLGVFSKGMAGHAPANDSMKTRRFRAIVALLFLGPPLYLAVLGAILVAWGSRDRTEKADVIMIFGAGVTANGQPSPILRARTRHAFELWERGLAPKIVCSGGVGKYRPAEAVVSAQLLRNWGVPANSIIIEDKSTSTRENALNTALLLPRGTSVIGVSQAFHLWRCHRNLTKVGFKVFTSPDVGWDALRPVSKTFYALREAVLVTRDVVFYP